MLRIYLISLICFLLLISLIITYEIYKISNNYILIYKYKKVLYNCNDMLKLAKIYIKQKRWLLCLLTLEKKIIEKNEFIADYYNSIGFCYYCIRKYYLSEYYYKQALMQQPNNTIFLCNLAKIYTLINKYKNASQVYEKVIKLDINNKIAQKELTILANK